jgi:co-chaperonin GroES (HSP10)
VAVAREEGAHVLKSGIIVPLRDTRHAHCGVVLAVGEAHRVNGKRLPLDVAAGERILYSSRVDSFATDGGHLDIVEEASIIGRL